MLILSNIQAIKTSSLEGNGAPAVARRNHCCRSWRAVCPFGIAWTMCSSVRSRTAPPSVARIAVEKRRSRRQMLKRFFFEEVRGHGVGSHAKLSTSAAAPALFVNSLPVLRHFAETLHRSCPLSRSMKLTDELQTIILILMIYNHDGKRVSKTSGVD